LTLDDLENRYALLQLYGAIDHGKKVAYWLLNAMKIIDLGMTLKVIDNQYDRLS